MRMKYTQTYTCVISVCTDIFCIYVLEYNRKYNLNLSRHANFYIALPASFLVLSLRTLSRARG